MTEKLPVTGIITVKHEPWSFVFTAIESVRRENLAQVILAFDHVNHKNSIAIERGDLVELADLVVLFSSCAGVSRTRNAALKLATQPYIAFLDGDDEWIEGKTKRQLEALSCWREPQNVFASSDVEHFVSEGYAQPDNVRAEKIARIPLQFPSNLLCHRDVFKRVGGFDEGLVCANDVDWFHRAMKLGVRRVHVQEVLVRKRIHDQNLSLHQGHDMQVQIMRVLARRTEPGMFPVF